MPLQITRPADTSSIHERTQMVPLGLNDEGSTNAERKTI